MMPTDANSRDLNVGDKVMLTGFVKQITGDSQNASNVLVEIPCPGKLGNPIIAVTGGTILNSRPPTPDDANPGTGDANPGTGDATPEAGQPAAGLSPLTPMQP